MTKTIATRIAPSPTGNLHLGTVRTALYNILLAKNLGGKFFFRLEDTDRQRSKEEFTQEIIDGFKWLSMSWDGEMVRQSERNSNHQAYIDDLIKQNKAYRCFATPEELEALRVQQRASKLPEGYDNRSRNIPDDLLKANLERGLPYVVRLNLGVDRDIQWDDMVRGAMSINTKDLGGDPVIQKFDGQVLYNFAVVVDDHDMGITHVVRGEDHLTNTAKQIAIYQALDFEIPEFGHLALIFTTDKQKLSKRKHGDIAGVEKYRKEGYLPEALVNYLLATSYTNQALGEIYSIQDAIKSFDTQGLSRSPAIYDLKKLDWYNREYMGRLERSVLMENFKKFLNYDLESRFNLDEQKLLIDSILGNCNKFSDINSQVDYFFDEFVIDEPTLKQLKDNNIILKAILDNINEADFSNPEAMKNWINTLGEKLSLKGKQLFWPIRMALSNRAHGPDLGLVMSLLGKESCIKRITKVI